MEEIIHNLPKAELHIHIEGTLEPELMFTLAKRNKINLGYSDIGQVKKSYEFTDLQSFLDIYYQASQVLKYEEDFYDLTSAYLKKASQQNVKHVEIFFDPQTHLARKVAFEDVVKGISRALKNAKESLHISSSLILCFLKDLPESSAFEILEKATDYKEIIGIGLDSTEIGNPPIKFKNLFKKAKQLGLKRVAHAGEEGPPEYIWEALDILDVERIDHGIRCMEDKKLVKFLAAKQIPLTVCPLSNVKLKTVASLRDHPLKKMLQHNLCVTVNSDDPAYFDGYIEENYLNAQKTLELNYDEIIQLAKNSFIASFLPSNEKQKYLASITQNF